MQKEIMELMNLILSNKIMKLALLALSVYILYIFGKSVGEALYYITR
jgi:hypothetical protein